MKAGVSTAPFGVERTAERAGPAVESILKEKDITEEYRLAAVGGPAGGLGLKRGGGWKRSEMMLRGATDQRLSIVSDFKRLRVWHKAHALSLSVDRICKGIRGSQYSSLRSQIFRAALSIPANIAEGRRQDSEKEFARFLRIARASASELESHLIFARDAKIISEQEFLSLVTETIRVRKMLYALIARVVSPGPPAGPPTAASR